MLFEASYYIWYKLLKKKVRIKTKVGYNRGMGAIGRAISEVECADQIGQRSMYKKKSQNTPNTTQ